MKLIHCLINLIYFEVVLLTFFVHFKVDGVFRASLLKDKGNGRIARGIKTKKKRANGMQCDGNIKALRRIHGGR